MIKGILFDMDGVLVDSEPVIEAAAIKGLKEYGVNAKAEDFKPFVGAGEDRYIGGVAKKYGVAYQLEMKTRVYELYNEIVDEHLRLYDGVGEVLGKLRSKGYKLALASSADMIKIKSNLRVADIPRNYFDTLLGGEDVKNKKPSPDIYLLAAKRLGLDSEACMVVEDALNGIEAATAAGMKSIGISTSFSKEALKSAGADYVCDHIKEILTFISKD